VVVVVIIIIVVVVVVAVVPTTATDPHHDGVQAQRKFEKHRESLLREYTNFNKETPYEMAMYYTRQLLEGRCWHLHQYIDVSFVG